VKDYYAILALRDDCSSADVRKAFRSRAKKMHPDMAGEDGTARFLALKEAYEVLSSSSTRDAYDQAWKSLRRLEETSDWDYRSFLRERSDDPASLARLVCYDLLHDLDAEAIELYDEAQKGGFFSLREHLGREEFMDYAFLLAEAYLKQNAVIKGYRLLRGIADLEEEHPYFKHFYVEVLERLALIVRHRLPEDPENILRITLLTDLVKLSYPPREEARLRKLLSELLSSSGRDEAAANELLKAYELAPALPGLAERVQDIEGMG